MNTVLIIVLIPIFFGGFVQANKTQHDCPDPNSEWTDCGTYCPKVCGQNTTEPCITLCKPGCQCKPGYILESVNGSCIPESKCKRCPDPNAEWVFCVNQCPQICGQDNTKIVCPLICLPGCQCKPGYVLDKNSNKCISKCVCNPKSCTL